MPQATDELEEAQAQLASAQETMHDLLGAGQCFDGASRQTPDSATGAASGPMPEREDIEDAANAASAITSLRLRNVELQKDRDEWRRRAERGSADLAALREHVTAVCAEGRHAEAGLLNAQQVTRNPINGYHNEC